MTWMAKFGARWAPFLLGFALFGIGCAKADPGPVRVWTAQGSSFTEVREALVEAIEEAGLVISHSSRFAEMLARTAKDLGHAASPYQAAETLQFCSAQAAWLLAAESTANVAYCPLGISIYALHTEPGRVYLAFKPLGGQGAGAQFADTLLEKICRRTLALSAP